MNPLNCEQKESKKQQIQNLMDYTKLIENSKPQQKGLVTFGAN